MERFECGTRVLSGPGSVSCLKELGAKRVLVVTDPYFRENGLALRVAECTGASQWELFDRVAPDPDVELAAEGTDALRKFDPDLIVALGGGSAMDCAKAMKYFSGSGAVFAAVPTTSGSGSEVTDFAILTHGGVKHPLVDGRLRPDVAILDSDLLGSLPGSLIADSGFDVVAHALEAWVATGAGAVTDALARDAFCTACANLPASFNGEVSLRQSIHTAATMAGMAFSQAGLGLCHAMAHSLGGKFHVPHGRLNAILLPAVVSCNATQTGHKYAELARAAGLGGSVDVVAVRNLKNALIRLRRQLQLPETLAQAGVDPARVRQCREELVATVLEDPCCATNPVKPTRQLVAEILEGVTGHG